MNEVFLSASVPLRGRGEFYKTASPFLIQLAVREFLIACLGRRLIVWGGHPAITPMVWAACEDLGVAYQQAVVLYQSRFFSDAYPRENEHFSNVILVDAVDDDRQKSLLAMRQAMFARSDLAAGVFVGGMEGVADEYALLRKLKPGASVLAVAATGGAARELAIRCGEWDSTQPEDLNFARMFYERLGVLPDEKRQTIPANT